ncbi:MAG: arginine--tRNA ligase [Terriglobia bacterium]
MYLKLQQAVREKFAAVARELFDVEVKDPALGFPPSAELGEISITACFDLAKQLHQSPRKIAEQIAARLLPLAGIERIAIAGAGYLNLSLDRAALATAVFRLRAGLELSEPNRPVSGKILVEHTSINPNKAAHIGHLRNAVLGDTLARLLRVQGREVEVQNYIDNTGVQVADVVVGFLHLERKSLKEVQALIDSHSSTRFDYYCWDLYARVFQRYESEVVALALRAKTLKDIEEGHGEAAQIAEWVSTAISRLHLETMRRMNVRYDLLVQESEILRLKFWQYAFELMKKAGAIHLEEFGKNHGCWVMRLDGTPASSSNSEDSGDEDAKIIVRSNGTVTYVGKDIAYHLWKFALLRRDFEYRRFYRYPDGVEVWRTSMEGENGAPSFGHGTEAYAVIDIRQSYLQEVVRRAFLALGYPEQAQKLHHFSYEVVGLAPESAAAISATVPGEKSAVVGMSGRKGLGVKADDLMDALVEAALREVRSREMTADAAEQESTAQMIAVSALRYFLLKYTRRTVIAFDFKEALAFEGETGPYLQYTVVRARNILRKFREAQPAADPERLADALTEDKLRAFFTDPQHSAVWELAFLCAQLELAVEQAVAAEEPAILAKFSFRLAQAFNNFYHHSPVLPEPDPERQSCLLFLVLLASETLAQALGLLGIEVPARM